METCEITCQNNFTSPIWDFQWKVIKAYSTSSRDFVNCIKTELLGKRVFVFLRNGKILNLTKGSTVIDVAFTIHTDIGLSMYGVEINGKLVSFFQHF